MGKQKWQPVLLAVPEAMKKEVKNRFLDVSSNSEHDDIDFSFGSDRVMPPGYSILVRTRPMLCGEAQLLSCFRLIVFALLSIYRAQFSFAFVLYIPCRLHWSITKCRHF